MMQMLTAMVILWFHNIIEMELKNLFMDLHLSILDLGEMEFLEKVNFFTCKLWPGDP